MLLLLCSCYCYYCSIIIVIVVVILIVNGVIGAVVIVGAAIPLNQRIIIMVCFHIEWPEILKRGAALSV